MVESHSASMFASCVSTEYAVASRGAATIATTTSTTAAPDFRLRASDFILQTSLPLPPRPRAPDIDVNERRVSARRWIEPHAALELLGVFLSQQRLDLVVQELRIAHVDATI